MIQPKKPKSLVQLPAEKIEQSIKQPAKLPEPSKLMSTLKTLAAQSLVKDKVKYWNKKAEQNASINTSDKKRISIFDMRTDEIRMSKLKHDTPGSTFQNLFENRLNRKPGKRDKV